MNPAPRSLALICTLAPLFGCGAAARASTVHVATPTVPVDVNAERRYPIDARTGD